MPSLSGVVNRLTTMHFSWLATLPGLVLVAVGMFVVTSGDRAYAGTCNNAYGYGYGNYRNYGRNNYCGGNYGNGNNYGNYGNYGQQYYPVQSAGWNQGQCQYGGNVGYGCGNSYSYGNNYGNNYGGDYGGYGNNYGYQQPVSNQAGAASQAGSSSAVNDSGNSQNTNSNTNNPTATATANVVVNPASTVMRPPMVSTAGYSGRPSMPMPSQIMLPETGTMDPILRFFGLGGLVAASTGYAISRRELMRSVFKRD